MHEISIRHAELEDHQPIIAVLDDWWGGRQASGALHKLFFITSARRVLWRRKKEG